MNGAFLNITESAYYDFYLYILYKYMYIDNTQHVIYFA